MRSREVKQRLVLERPLGLREHLAAESPVGEHAQVQLRLGGDVMTQRIVPHGEVGQRGGIVSPVEETDLVGTGLVELMSFLSCTA